LSSSYQFSTTTMLGVDAVVPGAAFSLIIRKALAVRRHVVRVGVVERHGVRGVEQFGRTPAANF